MNRPVSAAGTQRSRSVASAILAGAILSACVSTSTPSLDSTNNTTPVATHEGAESVPDNTFRTADSDPLKSAAGMIAALVTPIPVRQPPDTTLESIVATFQSDRLEHRTVRLQLIGRSELSDSDLLNLLQDVPVFPSDLASVPLPEGGAYEFWNRSVGVLPASQTGHSRFSYALWTWDPEVNDHAAIPPKPWDEPVLRILDLMGPVIINWSQLTWQPDKPDIVTVNLILGHSPDDRTVIAGLIEGRADASFFAAEDGPLTATTKDGAIEIQWQPDFHEGQLIVDFHISIDDLSASTELE